ncbi:hypothetical protein [Novipirellula artificiosorum]|uniref:hypothetical protein n=1 Tax=Novipirellula artificiosorum TaxID=2528016 RepID=UPI001E40129E|nr:hypothetical protein [Novipirellula artificiosorum]
MPLRRLVANEPIETPATDNPEGRFGGEMRPWFVLPGSLLPRFNDPSMDEFDE